MANSSSIGNDRIACTVAQWTQLSANFSTSSEVIKDPDPEEVTTYFSYALYHVTIPILFGLVSCCGVTGNMLVIYVIVSRRRMRTVINILLLNLALADLCFALVIPPSTAYVLATDQWLLGDAACRLMHYLVNVTAYVTVYTLVLISVNRYMTIVHSTSTVRFRTRPVTVGLIVGVWVMMGLLNAPVLTIYGSKRLDSGAYDCDLHDFDSGRLLFSTFFVFAYLYPLVVIAIFSTRILVSISSHPLAAPEMRHRCLRSHRRKRQISRMLIVVVVVFALLWLPVHVHLLVAFWGSLPTNELYQAVTILWYCLAYVNSCVNPLIYNRTSKDFRLAFRETLPRCLCAFMSSQRRPTDVTRAQLTRAQRNAAAATLPVYPRFNTLRKPVEKFHF